MAPATRQQQAWPGRGAATDAPPSNNASSSSRVHPQKWAGAFKFDQRIPVSPPTAPEAVTPPAPSNCYRGARHHGASDPSVRENVTPPVANGVAQPTVQFICNVFVNFKEVEMKDSDAPRLIRALDDSLFPPSNKGGVNSSNKGLDTVFFVSLDISQNRLSCNAIEQLSVR